MEQWTKQQFEKNMTTDNVALYVYTPMCGTCQVASKMMNVIEQLLPQHAIGKMDLNYEEQVARDYEIESVPCLLLTNSGKVTKKVYAFQSVSYLYELMKNELTG